MIWCVVWENERADARDCMLSFVLNFWTVPICIMVMGLFFALAFGFKTTDQSTLSETNTYANACAYHIGHSVSIENKKEIYLCIKRNRELNWKQRNNNNNKSHGEKKNITEKELKQNLESLIWLLL